MIVRSTTVRAVGAAAPPVRAMSGDAAGGGGDSASAAGKAKGKRASHHWLPHGLWKKEDLEAVKITHKPPETLGDKAAFWAMKVARTCFDTATGYGHNMNEKKYLQRILFLETVAGVPPMVGGMVRHLNSLRQVKRDKGWIHSLLEEAENERMHLMTFMELKKPTLVFRMFVLLAQGILFNGYFVTYLIAPKYCHRWVGYLEEEAVKTYTGCIEHLEAGRLPEWERMRAPPLAIDYWQLPKSAMMVDVLKAIRADEAHHRDVNHTLSSIPGDAPNPVDEWKL